MEVKLEKFSGPLELLLKLIEEEKLEVTEIALAQVTDQYLAYLEANARLVRESEAGGDELAGFAIGMAELADFLVVASRLLLIKSRALLPTLEFTDEEEESIRDLTLQLKEYRRYRDAVKALRALALDDNFIYTRPAWSGVSVGFLPPSRLSPSDLSVALGKVITSLEAFLRPLEQKLIARTISIEDKIREVVTRIEAQAKAQIQELAGSGKKSDLILAFLAVLFLFKEKVVTIMQSKRFGEISIVKHTTHGSV